MIPKISYIKTTHNITNNEEEKSLTRGNDASIVDKFGSIMAPRSSQLIFPLSLVRQIDSHS